ncbi:hypothetical protein [Arthrobacter sp. AD-310]
MALPTQKRADAIWTNAGFDVEWSPSGWKLGYADLVPPWVSGHGLRSALLPAK